MPLPDRVTIVEVGPRDGLQNEKAVVPAATKAELIDRLAEAGCTVIEAGAFVSPKWVPQMAGTPEVLAAIHRKPGVRYPVLVPNLKGLEAAIAARCDEVAVFASASEAFSQKNINCSIAESLERFEPVMERAREAGVKVRGYVSCVLGCPYQGDVPVGDVAAVSRRLHEMGCFEVSLGDTIGRGTPGAARAMTAAVAEVVPVGALALHFHDTYGQALANIHACLELGISVLDSAVGGVGGCPYAKGATGNVATEDLVYMLHGMGIPTGINLAALLEVSRFVSDAIGRPVPSHLAAATAA
ncbi:hydroxymethylglutaryl-CoA lyase [Acuticoccus sediminis]|uniref:hydroxymethylglutaryl-CoA lyase n=1 Tax=Acuticoccus sediminis TaxID=2184697 RepID=A0A8B2NK59_9HYPH|nr:hydroxymethylglutaryl-CoA lyase [Acuticoccus sediminis]RAH98877.1 hydroxymethylglutaryl-CoA lyase [Acuticoccus sediminis]